MKRPQRAVGTLSIAAIVSTAAVMTGAGVASAADPVPQQYVDQAFAVSGPSPTEDKPQSKLWFNDGAWWALMRTNTNGTDGTADVTIHRLQSDHTWKNTGTVVDLRASSSGDALWEGGKLYVASKNTSGAIQVARLSYDTSRGYTMDAGFPVTLDTTGTESVTIARDSQSRLWITTTMPANPGDLTSDQVYVAHTTTDDRTWTKPFLVPVPDHTVAADDISAVVTFGGKTGVMWSDQQDKVVRFAVHPDTSPDEADWSVETALDGPRAADDHLNLKSLMEDDQGRVYAAVKTSLGDANGDKPSDSSIEVLTRSSNGTWTPNVVATVGEHLTRPQLALDATNRQLYVVMSTESGGDVYYRRAPLGTNLAFSARATLLHQDGALINNATTAKAPVTAASGLVVLASDERTTMRYYHAELSLGGATPPPSGSDTTKPSAPSGVTAKADSSGQVTVSWTASTDDTGVASYQVTRNGTVVAEAVTGGLSFPDKTVAPSTAYSYTVTAVDAAGNKSAASAAATVTTPASTPAPGGSTPTPGGSTPAPGGSTPAPGGSTPTPGGSTPAPAPGGSIPAPNNPSPTPVGGAGSWFYLNDEKSGQANIVLAYGDPQDEVLVADTDGRSGDGLLIRRGNEYFVRNTLTTGAADYSFVYGDPGDTVLVGDWDGDGTDTLTVRRGNEYFVRNSLTSGVADRVVVYGNPEDDVLVGNWNGRSTGLAVRRGITFYLKAELASGVADDVFAYGNEGDAVLVGDWNGDGVDSLGVRRIG